MPRDISTPRTRPFEHDTLPTLREPNNARHHAKRPTEQMSTKFSRNSSRVQPVPKVCISHKLHAPFFPFPTSNMIMSGHWLGANSENPEYNFNDVISKRPMGSTPSINVFVLSITKDLKHWDYRFTTDTLFTVGTLLMKYYYNGLLVLTISEGPNAFEGPGDTLWRGANSLSAFPWSWNFSFTITNLI